METRPAYTLYTKILGAEHREAIVFLPGFTGSHTVWNSDFHALSQRYTLILLDILGFGHSPKPNIEYSLDDHLAAIHHTLQSLSIQRIRIVGHSVGRLLALAYAYHFPESVTQLALLALPCYQNEQEARETIARSSLMVRLAAMDTPLARIFCEVMCSLRPVFLAIAPWLSPDVPAAVARDALRHTWPSYSRTLRHVILKARTRDWLHAVRHPILVIQGMHDRIAPIENVQREDEQLPHVTLVPLDAGHRLIFTHSAEITAHIARFFDEPRLHDTSTQQVLTTPNMRSD